MSERHSGRSGFSLIEMLVVCALLIVIACLSFGYMHFLKKGYAKTEIDLLHQTCLYVRRKAMLMGNPCEIVLDLSNKRYHFCNRVHKLSDGVCFGFVPGAKGPPASAKTLITKACTFASNRIVCFPDGTISAGVVYMIDDHSKTCYALSNAVASYSYLRKYRYDEKWQRV